MLIIYCLFFRKSLKQTGLDEDFSAKVEDDKNKSERKEMR